MDLTLWETCKRFGISRLEFDLDDGDDDGVADVSFWFDGNETDKNSLQDPDLDSELRMALEDVCFGWHS